ncbi:4049_t:CDS:1 [Acaulospora morrowiae]|uniref:4049_t:CDS:1 n=1 Tax=Acaulospora morrowiae TaxID=94023 RepID=A0A9N9CR94_9GLOM|nr:4049_t:CDS:1 [Acaulospora morrowiae]
MSQAFSYVLPLQYVLSSQQVLKSREFCVHANLTSSYRIRDPSSIPSTFHGYLSSCEISREITSISGRFYNIPDDTNPKNYHLYLLNPDNSMRQDLSWIFSKGLIIKKDVNGVARNATLELMFRTADFPLRGANSYVGGWIKVYHIRDSVVTAAGPAQMNPSDIENI